MQIFSHLEARSTRNVSSQGVRSGGQVAVGCPFRSSNLGGMSAPRLKGVVPGAYPVKRSRKAAEPQPYTEEYHQNTGRGILVAGQPIRRQARPGGWMMLMSRFADLTDLR